MDAPAKHSDAPTYDPTLGTGEANPDPQHMEDYDPDNPQAAPYTAALGAIGDRIATDNPELPLEDVLALSLAVLNTYPDLHTAASGDGPLTNWIRQKSVQPIVPKAVTWLQNYHKNPADKADMKQKLVQDIAKPLLHTMTPPAWRGFKPGQSEQERFKDRLKNEQTDSINAEDAQQKAKDAEERYNDYRHDTLYGQPDSDQEKAHFQDRLKNERSLPHPQRPTPESDAAELQNAPTERAKDMIGRYQKMRNNLNAPSNPRNRNNDVLQNFFKVKEDMHPSDRDEGSKPYDQPHPYLGKKALSYFSFEA